MIDAGYADDLALFANPLAQTVSLLYRLEALASAWSQIKQIMRSKQERTISTLSDKSLKLVNRFTYIGNSVSSPKSGQDTFRYGEDRHQQVIEHMENWPPRK